MKMTLTTEEIRRAITCYLKANAAVDVMDIDFSMKRAGIVAEVDTVLLEHQSDSPEQVQPIEPDVFTSEEEDTFVPPGPEENFVTDESQLVEEEFPDAEKEPEPEQTKKEVKRNGIETPEMKLLREVDEEVTAAEIAAVELADESGIDNPAFELPELAFDSEVKPETVNEMPVQNTESISDILGLT
jgi:hypothetical protein